MNNIVVGFLDVETAQHAVREAAKLAKALGATLRVVTAIDESTVEVVGVGSDRFELRDSDRAEQSIDDFMRTLPDRPEYVASVGVGKPADVLIDEANRSKADLIVVGNVRMQGPGRLLGSVGSSVVHHAPCNVLIVKTS